MLPIISADERLKLHKGIKAVVLGVSGIGKTTQLQTLPEDTTLFIDLEAGDLAVQDWRGDTLCPDSWPMFRDLVVFLAGPNRALPADSVFSQAHFEYACTQYGDPAQLTKYETYFVDSITVLSRMCLSWAKTQPQALSERTGKMDIRGAYGLLGQEMIATLTHLQHARDKNVIFVAILEERLDDFNRKVFMPQLEGSKTSLELSGIVDEVITLAELRADDRSLYRAFICQTLNPWGYPAKDRSGRLDVIEEPHLGRLMTKILGPVRPAPERLQFTRPILPETTATEESHA